MPALEKQLKALANRRRLGILKAIKTSGPLCVGDLADAIKLSFKSTSKHLSILYSAGVLEKEQKELTVTYSLPTKPLPISRAIISIL